MTSKQLNRLLPPSNGTLTVDEWLHAVPDAISGLKDEHGDGCVDGIYCGESGTDRRYLPAIRKSLVVQWYRGRVDCAYIA